MPGIVGIISQRPSEDCQSLVAAMVRSMEHESFYTSGTHCVAKMGMYAGWVSHEGSVAAGQVFHNERRDIALIMSGECFTDSNTLGDLRRRGHEVDDRGGWLVHLYEEKGERFVESLNGLFSGLLIDTRIEQAILFNDRYGMERIYCYQSADATYFASEAKALLRVLPELRAFDEEGVAQFLTFGCTLEWRTLFRGLELLPGGSLWSFKNGESRKRRFFVPANWEAERLSVDAFETKFQETFQRILPRYFEPAARVGMSLTGGLDTRMMMACRPMSLETPISYTFAGSTGETLDTRLAGRVARVAGLSHQLLRLTPEFFTNFASYADRTVFITDGCFGVTGAHEVHLNRQARELAPIRLTGNFGSEVLRSMSTFKPLGLSADLVHADFGRPSSLSGNRSSSPAEHPVTFAAFKEIPWNLFGSLAAARSQVTFRTPYLDNDLVALAFQAPESVRRSSSTALRFVGAQHPALGAIPTDRGYSVAGGTLTTSLRRLFSEATFRLDYYGSAGLPQRLWRVDPLFERLTSMTGIVGLHRYLHYRAWFRRELAEFVMDGVSGAASRNRFWNPTFLRDVAKKHIAGHGNYVREINAVLTLDAIERLMCRGLAAAPTGEHRPVVQVSPAVSSAAATSV